MTIPTKPLIAKPRKKIRLTAASAVLVLLCLSSAVSAGDAPDELSGKRLLSLCMAPGEVPQSVCASRIAGFRHGLDYMSWKLGSLYRKTASVCVSKKPLGELKAAFVKYAQAHGKELDNPDWLVLTRALEEVFPCEKNPAED